MTEAEAKELRELTVVWRESANELCAQVAKTAINRCVDDLVGWLKPRHCEPSFTADVLEELAYKMGDILMGPTGPDCERMLRELIGRPKHPIKTIIEQTRESGLPPDEFNPARDVLRQEAQQLRATLARVEALPAKWRQRALEEHDGVACSVERELALELDAALRGDE